jgi:uncharacterized protein
MLAWQGPDDASHLVVLAPGDAGRLTAVAPTAIGAGLAAAGLRVARFEVPAGDDGDEARDAVLAASIRRAAASRAASQRLVLGGLSRGARVAADLVRELGAVGLLAFAFPFHARQGADPGDRVARLAAVPTPVLICQGTRDTHGNRQQVLGYRLPAHVRVHWLEDANHALVPRARSGLTQEALLAEAVAEAASFVSALR